MTGTITYSGLDGFAVSIDETLVIDGAASAAYGNNFNGLSDADGIVSFDFVGSTDDLILTLNGYDIDFSDEVEVILNGTSIGFLDTTSNNGLGASQFSIDAADQLVGTNVLEFHQKNNIAYAWGVDDVQLATDTTPPPPPAPTHVETLVIDGAASAAYGNNFNGLSDADGIVSFDFVGSTDDLILSLNGYDIDAANEVEVILNGTSIGFLDTTANNGLGASQFSIDAGDQLVGTNVVEFHQKNNIAYAWGIDDVQLATDTTTPPPPPPPAPTHEETLVIDGAASAAYGNNFNGLSNTDGTISFDFVGSTDDLILSLNGYDIDAANEVEVILNGTSIGFLDTTSNNGLGASQFSIDAADQLVGTNVVEFHQKNNIAYAWGVDDVQLATDTTTPPPPAPTHEETLVIDGAESAAYGNNFNGLSNTDGTISFDFVGSTDDLILSLNGYDIDAANEVEVILNGSSIGFLDTTANNGLGASQFSIDAGDQLVGTNVLEFHQKNNIAYAWGVDDVQLATDTTTPPPPPPPAPTHEETLVIDGAESAAYGNNFNGLSNTDGTISFDFVGSTDDLILSLNGYDVDFSNEVEVILNGSSIGFLDTTANNGLGASQFSIDAGDQLVGTNVLEFHQKNNIAYAWGVDDVQLATDTTPPPPPAPTHEETLVIDGAESAAYGNKFNGLSDADGIVSFDFVGSTDELILSLNGYDVDFSDEVEVILNGSSIGYLDTTPNNGLGASQFSIDAADQLVGTNVLEFHQKNNIAYAWGVDDVQLDTVL
ncbi:hypothetical protein QEZ52_09380 [Aliisedimentitalea scapharcae]|uniref:Uncharacterized protein n=1 Tax=Aliisedimentitalea scapharcae TaxID=1524259 RepID=A0ABZ2XXA6_9RHOB